MHRLTIFDNIDASTQEQIANLINTEAGYVLQKGEEFEGYIQLYFDGVKDSPQNKMLFARLRQILYPSKIDFILQEPYLPLKLICFDMDGTTLKIETMDEFCGYYISQEIKNKLVELTDQIISSDVDYKQGFKDKIKLIKGIEFALIKTFYKNNISHKQFSDGLVGFLAFANNNKIKTALLSGGFFEFAKQFALDAGFCYYNASKPQLTKNYQGNLVFDGNIVDENIFTDEDKKQALIKLKQELTLDTYNICAIGDGSNDIKMLKEAGLGIAYKARQIVKNNIDNWLEFNDFSVLKSIVL